MLLYLSRHRNRGTDDLLLGLALGGDQQRSGRIGGVGIEASMGRTESAVNYAMVESLVSTLKSELLSTLEFMEKIGKVRVSNRYVPHEER
jgi:hypothetical protein